MNKRELQIGKTGKEARQIIYPRRMNSVNAAIRSAIRKMGWRNASFRGYADYI